MVREMWKQKKKIKMLHNNKRKTKMRGGGRIMRLEKKKLKLKLTC